MSPSSKCAIRPSSMCLSLCWAIAVSGYEEGQPNGIVEMVEFFLWASLRYPHHHHHLLQL